MLIKIWHILFGHPDVTGVRTFQGFSFWTQSNPATYRCHCGATPKMTALQFVLRGRMRYRTALPLIWDLDEDVD